jgi:V/A-type H+/Na+-transporting ATPase subunit E
MTGLEKILAHIEDDAKATADTVSEKAKAEVDRILAEAKEEAAQKCADMNKQSELEFSARKKRIESQAALQKRELILKAKQQMISDIIEKTKVYLKDLSDQEYLETIETMIKKCALPKAGELLFSASDLNRLPAGFEEKTKLMLKDIAGASLSLSRETRNINGGFIVRYGDIEINCSFDALIAASKDEIQDKVYKLLFE